MSILSDLDISHILAPLPEGLGKNLKEDSALAPSYYHLRDLRSQARSREREAVTSQQSELIDPSAWNELITLASDLLQKHTKNLEVMAWLIEGLARYEGFSGLELGFRLAQGLLERHWDNLYPMPDEDGVETRLSPLINLNGSDGNGTLITPILCIHIAGSQGAHYCTWQFNQAYEVERISDPKKKLAKEANLIAHVDQFREALAVSKPDVVLSLYNALELCLATYQNYARVLDERAGEPQPTVAIKDALESCATALRYLSPQLTLSAGIASVPIAPDNEDGLIPQGASSIQLVQAVPNAPVLNRELALLQLKAIAEFFRKFEPHSPVSYSIDQAVRWSLMSLPDLLNELIEEKGARTRFCQLTGISAKE